MGKLSDGLSLVTKGWAVLLIIGSILTGGYQLSVKADQYITKVDTVIADVKEVRVEMAAIKEASHFDLTPPTTFPGFKHSATDAVAGGETLVTWDPIIKNREDCTATKLTAFTTDSKRITRSARILLDAPINLPLGESVLRYPVETSEDMASGLSYVFVQADYLCPNGIVMTVSTPRLPFTIKDQG